MWLLDKPKKTLEELLQAKLIEMRGELSQQAFADQLGVEKFTYQRWETATNVPQADSRAVLSEATGLSEGQLFADPDYVATPKEAVKILENAVNLAEKYNAVTERRKKLVDIILSPTFDEDETDRLLARFHTASTGELPKKEKLGKQAKKKADPGAP